MQPIDSVPGLLHCVQFNCAWGENMAICNPCYYRNHATDTVINSTPPTEMLIKERIELSLSLATVVQGTSILQKN